MYRQGAALAYYITSHGFGHAIRSCEVLRHLVQFKPGLDITIVTNVPEWLLEQNIGVKLPVRHVSFDVGLYQYDSVRFDMAKTLESLRALRRDAPRIVSEESEFLKTKGIAVAVSDIAFLPFEAAETCGVRGIGVSNFTWDWIYQAYERFDPEWRDMVAWARRCYSRCFLLLRLPMHGGCSACQNVEDVPLVARKSLCTPERVRFGLGIGDSKKLFLVSFTALELSDYSLRKLEKIEDVIFLYNKPLDFPLANARRIDGSGISYVDAVASVDAVITKPGYGIVSDCLANGTPVIYTERGLFREYQALVDEIERHLTAVYIDSDDFRAGDWEGAMRLVSSLPRKKPRLRIDGAQVAARRILEFL